MASLVPPVEHRRQRDATALPLEYAESAVADTPPAPNSPEYCLARAEECERLAEQTTMAVNKEIFLNLAHRWRTLATDDLRRVGDPQRSSTSMAPLGGKGPPRP